MNKTGIGAILLLSQLLLAGCGNNLWQSLSPSYSSQEACGFVQNVYGQRISWKGKTPIPIAIHESVPAKFYPAIEGAIKQWETAIGRPLFQITTYGVKGPLQPRQDGLNVIYWMDTWEADRSSEQARTLVQWVGNEIREADMRINAKDYTFYLDTAASAREVHFESLIVHELGHVLGLKHNDSGGSVMATYLASNTERDQVPGKDTSSVHCEY